MTPVTKVRRIALLGGFYHPGRKFTNDARIGYRRNWHFLLTRGGTQIDDGPVGLADFEALSIIHLAEAATVVGAARFREPGGSV
ncbi:MAG: hypothetical protein ACP5QA_04365 [Phycisphaerae bacterium]